MAKVTIVIVNYNGKAFQNDCIRTLKEMEYQDFEIVVVDSGSTDDSISLLQSEFPDVHLIKCNENVGVAKGNNIGIQYSINNGSEYTLLSNNDIEVDKKALNFLIENADENTVTVPKIYYYDPSDLIWYAGGKMDWKVGESHHIGYVRDEGQYDDKKYYDYAPTCFMLIHNKMFDKVGLEDENYFMYYDDDDLCVRMIDEGYKILYVPEAKIWHKVSSTSGGVCSKTGIYYSIRNQLYFMKKYKEHLKKGAITRVAVKNVIRYIVAPVKNKYYRYIPKAYSDYKNGSMGRQEL